MSKKPDVDKLVVDNDVEGLLLALRYRPDPGVRAPAARALGDRYDFSITEPLVRAYYEDPDQEVHQAASQALDALFAQKKDQVIASYAGMENEEQPWLLDDEGDNSLEVEEASAWDSGTITALFRMAYHDRDPQKRLKAVKALGRMRNTSAIEVLQQLALDAEEEPVRAAAHSALTLYFGGDTDAVLQAFNERRRGELEEEGEENEELEEEGSPFEQGVEYAELPMQDAKPFTAQSSVVQEENPGRVFVFVVVLALSGLIAALVFLLIR